MMTIDEQIAVVDQMLARYGSPEAQRFCLALLASLKRLKAIDDDAIRDEDAEPRNH